VHQFSAQLISLNARQNEPSPLLRSRKNTTSYPACFLTSRRTSSLWRSMASRMASGWNSQSEAARVMSENTITTSPSGAFTAPAGASRDRVLDDDPDELDVVADIDGYDNDPLLSPL
jgi:hypothetical protein